MLAQRSSEKIQIHLGHGRDGDNIDELNQAEEAKRVDQA